MNTERINQLCQISEAIPNITFEEEMQGGASDDMDDYEREMHAIFEKAREYRTRMSVVEDQEGGLTGAVFDEGKNRSMLYKAVGGKREMPPKLMAMLKIGGIVRDSGKFKELKYRDFVSVGKLIYVDAEKKSGSDDVDKVLAVAMDLVKSPDAYVAKFKAMPPKEKKAKKAKKMHMSSLF